MNKLNLKYLYEIYGEKDAKVVGNTIVLDGQSYKIKIWNNLVFSIYDKHSLWIATLNKKNKFSTIDTIDVNKNYRRRGIATALYTYAKHYLDMKGIPLNHSKKVSREGEKWIGSLKEIYNLIIEGIESFKIPPLLKKNFKIVGNINNTREWKAKVILANSGSVKIGQWDQVGYVMIDVKNNYIVPIARTDEHNTGYELMWHYKGKGLLPDDVENYESIWTYGYTYAYDDKDTKLVRSLKKYLNYGGDKHTMIKGMGGDFQTDIESFIDSGGSIKYEKDKEGNPRPTQTLSKLGTKIVGFFDSIVSLYKKIESNKFRENSDNIYDLFEKASQLFTLCLNSDIISRDTKKNLNWDGWQKNQDYSKLMAFIMGTNGIKNIIHNNLKKFSKLTNADDKKWNGEYMSYISVFGNIDLAIQELNRISNYK